MSDNGRVNIAKLGVATQESTGWGGSASRAIDGNKSGGWGRYVSDSLNSWVSTFHIFTSCMSWSLSSIVA